MYKCDECGAIFEEPRVMECYAGDYGEERCYEEIGVCPNCGGDFSEAKACKLCGGYEHMEIGEEVCEECKSDLLKRYHDIIDDEFSNEEIEELYELLEG